MTFLAFILFSFSQMALAAEESAFLPSFQWMGKGACVAGNVHLASYAVSIEVDGKNLVLKEENHPPTHLELQPVENGLYFFQINQQKKLVGAGFCKETCSFEFSNKKQERWILSFPRTDHSKSYVQTDFSDLILEKKYFENKKYHYCSAELKKNISQRVFTSTPDILAASACYKKNGDFESFWKIYQYLKHGMPRSYVLNLLGEPAHSPTQTQHYYFWKQPVEKKNKFLRKIPNPQKFELGMVLNYYSPERPSAAGDETLVQSFFIMPIGE